MDSVEIYTGTFGSGKTEIVLNRALDYAAKDLDVCVIDLDITKPFFRSREHRNLLEDRGISIVIPDGSLAETDLPIVSPKIIGTLTSMRGKVLIDVGGDYQGAIVLGRFAKMLKQRDCEMFFVINPYRPRSMDFTRVVSLIEQIETASRLEVSAIVSNPNLGSDTTLPDIIEGFYKVKNLAHMLKIPIAFCSALAEFSPDLSKEIQVPVLELMKMIVPPWESQEIAIIPT
ncbi:MAG: hypothetical protein M0T74_04455 [Desulfitobacterium hafniense]|nr:hypothetical protein [Desulfitobacterium hafniense]